MISAAVFLQAVRQTKACKMIIVTIMKIKSTRGPAVNLGTHCNLEEGVLPHCE